MQISVLQFPGINRQSDMARALTQATGREPQFVWHDETRLPDATDLVVLPGGFSYGDYLRCGAIAARANIMDAVADHAAKGGYVLGICNGFQILCERGLLPGVLMRNRDLKFICKMQYLRVERNDTGFSHCYIEGQVIKTCIAHGEGNYITDDSTLAALEDQQRVAFRYCDEAGNVTDETNPNGSFNNIAGIYSKDFRVLGMMPHPENLIDELTGGIEGRGLFDSIATMQRTAA